MDSLTERYLIVFGANHEELNALRLIELPPVELATAYAVAAKQHPEESELEHLARAKARLLWKRLPRRPQLAPTGLPPAATETCVDPAALELSALRRLVLRLGIAALILLGLLVLLAIPGHAQVDVVRFSGNGITGTTTFGGPFEVICSTNITCTRSGPNLTIVASSSGSTAWSAITAATNSNAGMFAASGNVWDWGAATSFEVPNSAGAAPTASGLIAYDTTANKWVFGQNGSTVRFALETITLTGGAGIAAIGDLSANRTIATASGETDFLASGALTCGAAAQGRMQVHTTPLQYCDNAATPTLQYAAYGTSTGQSVTGDALTGFFPAFTVAQLAAELSDENFTPGSEASAEGVLDLPDLQGILTAAKGGTGDDTSAITGVPEVVAGDWTYTAGLDDLGDVVIVTPVGGDVLCYDGVDARWENCLSSGYDRIQDEGTNLTQRATLNFAGAGVSCADDTTRTTCTIAGGGSSAWSALTAPTAATTFVSDATGEIIDFQFQAAFTTGVQYAIRQNTGNPTGGTLFGLTVVDPDVLAMAINDGTTNVITLNRAGTVSGVALQATSTATAGYFEALEGAAVTLVANSFQIVAPVDVAVGGLQFILPAAAGDGCVQASNAAGKMTLSVSSCPGGGSGDAIEIEDGDNLGTFTAIDTTARFDDSGDINFTFADGGAGGPDTVTATVRADSVALTTDTTGNYVLSVATGLGLAGGAAASEGATLTLDIDLNATLDGVGAISSLSGMEFTATAELALLQGCSDNQVLKWEDTGGTWDCANDADTGGAPAWNAITNPAGNLSLTMGTNTSTFSTTTAVADLFKWANTTAATASVSQSSPFLSLAGTYWTGAASAEDKWTVQVSVANGTNGATTLAFTHSGSTGAATLSAPAFASTSSGAGYFECLEGAAPSLVANSFQIRCGVDIAAGGLAYVLPVAAATGIVKATNSAGVMTLTHDGAFADLGGTIAAGQYGAATIDGDDINSNIAGVGLVLTAAAPDTLDIATTEIDGNRTWGAAAGATIVWTWDLSAGDPSITFGNAVVNVSSGTLQVGGVAVPTISSTDTFTNKTIDAEGTGNAITTVSFMEFLAAACTEGTAGLMLDTPTGDAQTAPTAACNDTGAIQVPTASYAGGAVNGGEISFRLPSDWTGNIDLEVLYVTTAASPTGSVEFDVSTVCRAVAEAWDGAFNAAQVITDTVGSQNAWNLATQTSLTTTGCAADELMHVRISRDGTNDSNNDAALVKSVRVKLRRAQ